MKSKQEQNKQDKAKEASNEQIVTAAAPTQQKIEQLQAELLNKDKQLVDEKADKEKALTQLKDVMKVAKVMLTIQLLCKENDEFHAYLLNSLSTNR